jgi:hypothetical protein
MGNSRSTARVRSARLAARLHTDVRILGSPDSEIARAYGRAASLLSYAPMPRATTLRESARNPGAR